jgi:hypothetical protein
MPRPQRAQDAALPDTAAQSTGVRPHVPTLTAIQKHIVGTLMAWPNAMVISSVDYQRVRSDIQYALAALATHISREASDGRRPSVVRRIYHTTPTLGLVCDEHPDEKLVGTQVAPPTRDPISMLQAIQALRDEIAKETAARKDAIMLVAVLIEDFHALIDRQSYQYADLFATAFRELAGRLKTFPRSANPDPAVAAQENEVIARQIPRVYLVAVGADRVLPESLAPMVVSLRYPLPTGPEIQAIVKAGAAQAEHIGLPNTFDQASLYMLTEMLRGLPGNTIATVLPQAVIKAGEFGPAIFEHVLLEKKAAFERMVGHVAQFIPPPRPFQMAGYDHFKHLVERMAEWLRTPNPAWPFPLGALLIGWPGTGKTRMALYTSAVCQIPVISLSMGLLASDGRVGSGQANLMRVLDALAAIGRCALLLDELIKETDTPENAKRGGGTSEHLRTLANFMTWMESRERGVFVLATGNTGDLQSGLPEGLMERFPYIFFVDRPDAAQRAEIWKIHLEQQGCDPAGFDLEELASETDGLVGRDIRNLLDEALGLAFDRKEPLAQEHILKAIEFFRHNLVEVGPHRFIPATPPAARSVAHRGYAEIDNPYTT